MNAKLRTKLQLELKFKCMHEWKMFMISGSQTIIIKNVLNIPKN